MVIITKNDGSFQYAQQKSKTTKQYNQTGDEYSVHWDDD